MSIGISIVNLGKVIGMANKDDKVTIRNDGINHIIFGFEDTETDKYSNFYWTF